MDLINFEKIREQAASHDARLVAVSKTRSVEEIKTLYDHGQRIFGENRLGEILKKKPLLPNDIHWHLIGPLQSKKIRNFDKNIRLFHALDRVKIWRLLNEWATEHQTVVDALIQMHIAQEEAKHGFTLDDLNGFLGKGEHRSWHGVRITGVMGMATFTTDEGIIEKEFEMLRDIFADLKQFHFPYPHFKEISMGMSGDYPIALKRGATLIRIGSSIFGPRQVG